MVMAGKGPAPSGTNSQPRSFTPPSTSNSTSVRLVMTIPLDGSGGHRIEEIGGQAPLQPPSQLCGKSEGGIERPVMNRDIDDLAVSILGEDGDAQELHA